MPQYNYDISRFQVPISEVLRATQYEAEQKRTNSPGYVFTKNFEAGMQQKLLNLMARKEKEWETQQELEQAFAKLEKQAQKEHQKQIDALAKEMYMRGQTQAGKNYQIAQTAMGGQTRQQAQSPMQGIRVPRRTENQTNGIRVAKMPTDPMEARRIEKENRLQKQQNLNILRTYGGSLTDEGLKDLGIDSEMYALAGGAAPTIKDGKRTWLFKPYEEFKRTIDEKKWNKSELDYFQNMSEENNRWKGVVKELSKLGITPENAEQFDSLGKFGEIGFESVMTPMGAISLPARFDLTGQYSQDPKYSALKRQIELAFQAFRKRTTGAQASDRELRMLRELMPALADKPSVFFDTIFMMMNTNADVANERLELYNAFGRDTKEINKYIETLRPEQKKDSLGIR